MANSDDGEKNGNGISSPDNNISKQSNKVSDDLSWQSSHRKLSKPNSLDLKRENHVDVLQTPDLNKVIISSPQLDSLVAQFPPTLPNLPTPALALLSTMEIVNSNSNNTTSNNHQNSVSSHNFNNIGHNSYDPTNSSNNGGNLQTTTNGLSAKSHDEDKLKLERKRERNRQAAAKCRNKKIQKITELEAKKAQLVKQRESLAESIRKYQEEIESLQRVLLERIKGNKGIDIPF